MFNTIAQYPIENILQNPERYVPNDGTIDLLEFITSTGTIIISLGYDEYNCLYYFVKNYPSFTYTVHCNKNELNEVYTNIVNDFMND